MRVARRFVITIVAVLLPLAVSSFVPQTAQAADVVGRFGMGEFDRYCQSLGYQGHVVNENDAVGVKCATGSNQAGINMWAACRYIYGNGGNNNSIISQIDDYYNPYGWQCAVVSGSAGRLDVPAYCRSMGYTDARLVENDSYGWMCVGSQYLNDDRLDSVYLLDQGCRAQTHHDDYYNYAIATIGNFHDPRDITCWV